MRTALPAQPATKYARSPLAAQLDELDRTLAALDLPDRASRDLAAEALALYWGLPVPE